VTLINRNIEQKTHENSKNPESHTKARKLRLKKKHKEPRWHVNLNRYENSVEWIYIIISSEHSSCEQQAFSRNLPPSTTPYLPEVFIFQNSPL
jgi:hypothetical protein